MILHFKTSLILHKFLSNHVFKFYLQKDRKKVRGRNDPPRNVRAREFKAHENKEELARQKKYTKEARSKRRILVDPTFPSWIRGLYNAINNFLSAHDKIDR